jgi:hypothetical protein
MAIVVAACGKSATDAPLPPLTTVARIEIQPDGDSVLVGDTLTSTARGLNREGTVVSLTTQFWSTSDSSVGSVSSTGAIRARNVGSFRLDVLANGVVGSKAIRVVSRALRVRVVAPDTAQIVDDVQVVAEVETSAGLRLTEVAPRFAVTDTAIASITAISVGTARLTPNSAGNTDLLAIIGRDTTRQRIVIRPTPLRSLAVSVLPRVLSVGDSVPYLVTAIDTTGRSVSTRGTRIGVEPAGTMMVRNGHLIALGAGRVELRAVNGPLTARDTITGQGPSEFPLEILDGDGQNPLPLRVLLSMERVAHRWRRIIRSAPAGESVRLQVGDCRNRVPVIAFITGVRVLIRLDSLFSFVAAQGGPCVMRANGLPLVGTVQININYYGTISDAKLDDLIMHEVGHVLGIGSVWGHGPFTGLVAGDSNATDPIFLGPYTLSAFNLLGGSARFTGRRVPIELKFLSHWRASAFAGELMAPSLIPSAQPVSAVTVASLRDIGWNVEPEAYEEYSLEPGVLTGRIAPRVTPPPAAGRTYSLDDDMLLPQLIIMPGGRVVKFDPTIRAPLK